VKFANGEKNIRFFLDETRHRAWIDGCYSNLKPLKDLEEKKMFELGMAENLKSKRLKE
jgi:hypothetical protein